MAACVIAQRHSSAIIIVLRLHSRAKQFGARFKDVVTSLFLTLLKTT
jgi:hypothetical protein